MKSIHDLIADESLATQGKWFDYDEDVKFKIAWAGGDNYVTKMDKLLLRARRLNKGKEPNAVKRKEILVEAVFDTVLLGWKGITEEFNLENVKILLGRPSDIMGFILTIANDPNNFKEEGEESVETPADQLKSSPQVVSSPSEGSASA